MLSKEILTIQVRVPSATHNFDDLLTIGDTLPKDVLIYGYLGHKRSAGKKLLFAPLINPDPAHAENIQLVSFLNSSDSLSSTAHEALANAEPNSPVAIRGLVKRRKAAKDAAVGERAALNALEIEIQELHVFNQFPKDIIVTADTVFPGSQRHLQLRMDPESKKALVFRSGVMKTCRQQLADLGGFTEIETPLLFKSTPEGAREFLVPTRRKGLAYALPQSPQQYKQMLMASGMKNYYQFAKCFRDEDQRADRQPEFTQLDMEMSFATGENVMQTVESIASRLWKEHLNYDITHGAGKVARMTYQDAMSRFGSDKPDTRLGMELSRIDHLIPIDLVSKISPLTNPIVEMLRFRAESVSPRESRQFLASFLESPAGMGFNENPHGGPGIFIVDPSAPLNGLQPFGFEAAEHIEDIYDNDLQAGDILILQARPNEPHIGAGSTPLGNLRLALHKAAVQAELIDPPTGFNFHWITEFPLFSPSNDTDPGQGGTAGLAATHHPFTAPKRAQDVAMLVQDPTQVIADHYDLVVNGVELGGGSRRIHDAAVQQFVLRDVLKMTEERLKDFEHLIEVLRAGCPPHAGFAIGFDRLIAVMLGKESVRDVIAFPKTGRGEDPLVKSPSLMTEGQMKTYHLKLVI